MAINPVQIKAENTKSQLSFKQQKVVKPYLEANETITTENYVKPLPPIGHLVDDNILTGTKYFFKDMVYDAKAVKDGITGKANDHQLGRLNDVGLKLGGIGIAGYLASKTANPKARLMEYIGLATFLTSMNIYPKLAINTPARILHGYDIDKEYIDDQGRKKSVQQDSNYVPYDMYTGNIEDEDLDYIGDRMGIPTDIKNRHDIIKEQMRKIATQNNTLWMLTAGFATPAMTALICYGLENYVVSPSLEKARNAKYNKDLTAALNTTERMTLDINDIKANELSSKVKNLLIVYKDKELPKEEFEKLVRILTENLDNNVSNGIKEDLAKILSTSAGKGSESVILDSKSLEEMVNAAKNSIRCKNKSAVEKAILPTAAEIESTIKKVLSDANFAEGTTTNIDNVGKIKQALKELIDTKIAASTAPKAALEAQRNNIIEGISKSIKTKKSSFISADDLEKVVNFAKIIGEFKQNQIFLDTCKSFKFEYAQETVLARAYSKFENTLLKELGVSFNELKKMRESEEFTREILDKKITELCNDEKRYKKAFEKLGKVISEMETTLHGSNPNESYIQNLINAIENNYNNTAKRLSGLENGAFSQTINRLVKEDVSTLSSSVTSREMLNDVLDGTIQIDPLKTLRFDKKENWNIEIEKAKKILPDLKESEIKLIEKTPQEFATILEGRWNGFSSEEKAKFLKTNWWNFPSEVRNEYLRLESRGIGSSKSQEIGRIIERYQGAKNSFNRILHSLEVYKRSMNPEEFAKVLGERGEEYVQELIKLAKKTLLTATSSDHNLKLDLVNNPMFYKDLMSSVWAAESGDYWTTKQKGFVTESAKEALGKDSSLLERFQYYITRFRNIVANSPIDFTKPNHNLDSAARDIYTSAEKTRMSFFNLIGKTPVNMVKDAADRRYTTQKWVRIISGITATVFGGTILAQFGFGRIRNPHNIQKVTNETDK